MRRFRRRSRLDVDVARVGVGDREDGGAEHGDGRPRCPQGAAAAALEQHPAGDPDRGEDHQGQRCGHQVAVDHAEAARGDQQERHDAGDQQCQRDLRTGAGEPEGERNAGDGDEQHGPLQQQVEVVERAPGQVRELRAPAELLGGRGRVVQRVQRVAGHDQIGERPDHRCDGGLRGADGALAPGGVPAGPQPVQAGQQPRLGAQQAGGGDQPPDRAAAPRPALFEHRAPDQQREVSRVQIAARRQVREVQAGDQEGGGRQAHQRVKALLAERVDAGDRDDEAGDADADQHLVGGLPERDQQDAERQPQRMLSRDPVVVETRQHAVPDLAAPDQGPLRVERGRDGIGRVPGRSPEAQQRQGRELGPAERQGRGQGRRGYQRDSA